MKIKRYNESGEGIGVFQNLKSEILSLLTDITDEYDSLGVVDVLVTTDIKSRTYIIGIRIAGFNKIFEKINISYDNYESLDFFKLKKDVTSLIINTAIRIEETLGVEVVLSNVYNIGGELTSESFSNWVDFKIYISM
jgi:hypothetical protein